ncbi:MAG: UDP-N-acetyl glucosamine 2-epimerase [Candidatus Thiodiazotropha sp.]
MKVITILGTRPEIIRLSRVIAALDEFVEELGVRRPDHFLNVDTSSLGKSLGEILIKTEEVLLAEKPDAVLVLGDTNSATCVLMAKRMKIPTYHMEAGNRSFDKNVPEETNRKMVDHLADFNLVYTEHARRHLISEGLPHRFIYLTGSPMREVLDHMLPKINGSKVLEKLDLIRGKYFIVSAHREENVDSKERLLKVIECLHSLYEKYRFPIIVSTHPRTRDRLTKLGNINFEGNIRFLKPFGFIDYNNLQMHAYCAISDSGTISEESSILAFPAVTLRSSIERPEALDTGAIALTGLDPQTLLKGIEIATASRDRFSNSKREIPVEYKITNTSERVIRLITGTAKLASQWQNISDFSRYDWE